MTTQQQQLKDLLKDLHEKRDRLETSQPSFQAVPPHYVGIAIYEHIIGQIKEIVNDK